MNKTALGEALKGLEHKPVGSWSKYGGEEYGLDKESLRKWYCQACGEEQPKGLVGFMLSFTNGGYVRVCAKCFRISRSQSYSYQHTVVITRYSHRRSGES